ncbi:MAG: iron export ABC transporter permease subunit FetB [Desulfocapsaceae bacterium]|nr:iron export ABC transporter permease subunit FetB [Desulfocapsaceae bacterium]
MQVIPLSTIDLSIAAALVVFLALLSNRLGLGLSKRLLISGLRMTAQLMLIGLILRQLFASYNVWLILILAAVMILIAGREILTRQKIRLRGMYGYGVGVISITISSFTIALFSLLVIIEVEPWYTPQYAIPLIGMLLGNTMTGISLATDRLTTDIHTHRNLIEQRLYLGETWQRASEDIRKNAMRTGMIPIINAMAAAGVVSLPGTMTGQILGGSPPLEAVKYQILILFLIAAGTGFGVVAAIWLTSRSLFDKRYRLCLEKLKKVQ